MLKIKQININAKNQTNQIQPKKQNPSNLHPLVFNSYIVITTLYKISWNETFTIAFANCINPSPPITFNGLISEQKMQLNYITLCLL